MNGVIWKGGSIQMIGPEQAEAWLEDCYVENYQREIKLSHVKKLAELMGLQSYLTGHVALASMMSGGQRGKTLIANGAHSLSAIVRVGVAQRMLVEHYECENDQAFANLFHAFDTEERKRTWKECARAMLLGATALNGTHATRLNEFRSGYELYQRIAGEEPEDLRYERFAALAPMAWIVEEFDQLQLAAVSQMPFRRAAVVAAIIATFLRSEDDEGRDKVRDFWRQVVTGFFNDVDNQGRNYPPYRLHNHIRNSAMVSARLSDRSHQGEPRKRVLPLDLYAACINAFNAWLRSQPLNNLRGAITTEKSGTRVPAVLAP